MTVKTDNVQIGQNATATQNFVLKQGADGTCTLARGNVGATTQDVLTVDAAGLVSSPAGSKNLTLMTAQATTSGTSIDFTSIPSWVKRITVILTSVSTSSTSRIRFQIGSGSVETSGYTGVLTTVTDTAVGGETCAAAGFDLRNTFDATSYANGQIIFTLHGSNIWVCAANVGIRNTTSTTQAFIGGSKTTAGTLDRIRMTTVNGTDTFDAGSVNVMYEG